jgi:hypothetical protein
MTTSVMAPSKSGEGEGASQASTPPTFSFVLKKPYLRKERICQILIIKLKVLFILFYPSTLGPSVNAVASGGNVKSVSIFSSCPCLEN